MAIDGLSHDKSPFRRREGQQVRTPLTVAKAVQKAESW